MKGPPWVGEPWREPMSTRGDQWMQFANTALNALLAPGVGHDQNTVRRAFDIADFAMEEIIRRETQGRGS